MKSTQKPAPTSNYGGGREAKEQAENDDLEKGGGGGRPQAHSLVSCASVGKASRHHAWPALG